MTSSINTPQRASAPGLPSPKRSASPGTIASSPKRVRAAQNVVTSPVVQGTPQRRRPTEPANSPIPSTPNRTPGRQRIIQRSPPKPLAPVTRRNALKAAVATRRTLLRLTRELADAVALNGPDSSIVNELQEECGKWQPYFDSNAATAFSPPVWGNGKNHAASSNVTERTTIPKLVDCQEVIPRLLACLEPADYEERRSIILDAMMVMGATNFEATDYLLDDEAVVSRKALPQLPFNRYVTNTDQTLTFSNILVKLRSIHC